jgi:lantibiotic modifying enzyme
MSTPDRDLFLGTADRIGTRLCRDAIWAGDRCNWLGPSMEFVSHRWAVVQKSFGPDLYGGTAGIALFLGHLFATVGEPLFRDTALAAARQALAQSNSLPPASRHSFYAGLTGLAYTLFALEECGAGDAGLGREAARLLEGLEREPPSEHALDLVAGSAGAIPALLALARKRPDLALGELALRHGERLLEAARRSAVGWSWDTLGLLGRDHLTGFAHGAAGIAWALLELYQETGEERFLEGAREGFRYEAHWYSPKHENWPDLRDFSSMPEIANGGQVYAHAWCHGAAGIGLSRLRATELLSDPLYRTQAAAALRSTSTAVHRALAEPQPDHSLCHGLCGNLEVLLYGGDVLGDAPLRATVLEVARRQASVYENAHLGWPCGVQGALETPGLMLGLAGIGYFYLRLANPDKVPDVLLIRDSVPAAGELVPTVSSAISRQLV